MRARRARRRTPEHAREAAIEVEYTPGQIPTGTGGKQIIYGAPLCTLDAGDEIIVPAL